MDDKTHERETDLRIERWNIDSVLGSNNPADMFNHIVIHKLANQEFIDDITNHLRFLLISRKEQVQIELNDLK